MFVDYVLGINDGLGEYMDRGPKRNSGCLVLKELYLLYQNKEFYLC